MGAGGTLGSRRALFRLQPAWRHATSLPKPCAPQVGDGEYFLALLPDGGRLVHPIAYGERFPLDFGRKVRCGASGVTGCGLPCAPPPPSPPSGRRCWPIPSFGRAGVHGYAWRLPCQRSTCERPAPAPPHVQVLAELAGVPERADWKACALGPQQEAARTEAFKKVFSQFDIMS